ncbi:MAG: MGMT family protein [Deltaproteobacteria bacterium]|nr:MGMT family protein [Deltaproteobacteria bacterium]
MIGSSYTARAVGGALRRNLIGLIIPCHRVVSAADIGEFFAFGRIKTKLKLLSIEGVKLCLLIKRSGKLESILHRQRP